MSTLSEVPWPMGKPATIQSFEYPCIGDAKPIRSWITPLATPNPADDPALQKLAQAREQGVREGELRARAVFEEALNRERSEIANAIRAFACERTTYYERLETEVVQLALSVARKILHREAQTDPLLMSEAVRAAIGKISQGTTVIFRIHGSSAQEWRQFLHSSLGSRITPEVVEDSSLGPGQCLVQTHLGETLVSIDSQMQEVENGFFDLLAHRPEPRPQAIQ